MAFTLSGGVITQSGTDADLSGLSGIAGVAVSVIGNRTYYTSDHKIVINGTLTIEPENESLVIKYSGQASPSATDIPSVNVMLTVNGTLTIGSETVELGFTRYSEGDAIYIEDTPDRYHPYVHFADTSTIVWYGGVISQSHGCSYWESGADIQTKSENARYTYRGSSVNNQIRLYTEDFVSDAFTFVGGDLTIIALGSQINGYSPIFCTGALSHSGYTPNEEYVIRDYAGGDQGNEKDVKQWSGNRAKLYNSKTGTLLRAGSHIATSDAYGTVRVYSELDATAVEFGGGAIEGAKLYIKDYNNGNRRLYNQEAPIIDLQNDIVYTATSNSSGVFPTQLVLTGAQLADTTYGSFNDAVNTGIYSWDYRSKNGDTTDLFDVYFASYNHFLTQLTDVTLKGVGGVTEQVTMFVDTNISQSTKATVDAYTALETSAKFYDRAKSYLVDNYAGETSLIVSRAGTEIDAGSYNVTIDATAASAFAFDGTTITIKASTFTGDMATTGVITLANGAEFIGTRTDANGTVAPPKTVSITGITAGSRLRVFNTTTSTEVVNQIVSGTSYSATYEEGGDYSEGDTVNIRVTYINGTSAKLGYTVNAVVGSSGWSALIEQVDDSVYNSFEVDGSAITQFSADYVNDQVDIVIGSNFYLYNFYAWWVYNLTTEDGIRDFFGGIEASDEANFEIKTNILSLYLDNSTNTNIRQLDNRRLFRADGDYPVLEPTTGGGGIDIVWRNQIFIAQVPASSGIAAEIKGANVTRNDDDQTPVLFTFPLESIVDGDFIKTRRVNGGISEAISGTISYLYDVGGKYWYELSYDSNDRPANEGSAQYTFINGGKTSVVNLHVTPSLDSTDVRSAVGLASANLDTQLSAVQSNISSLNNISVSDIESSSVLAKEATLDTKASQASVDVIDSNVDAIKERTDNLPNDPVSITDISTLATQTSIDALNDISVSDIEASTVLAKEATVAGLNDLDSTEVQAAASAALTAYDPPTKAELNSAVAGLSTFDATTDTVTTDSESREASKADISTLATQTSIDALNDISVSDIEASTVLAKEATVSSKASQTSVDSLQTSVDAIPTTDSVADLTPVLTAIASLNDPTPTEIRAAFNEADFKDKNTEAEIHTWLDSYLNKDDWKDGAVDLQPIIDLINGLNDFNPATDTVARVTLVDTTTTNTDMRGTDGANTTAPDNTAIAAIKERTDNLPDDPASNAKVEESAFL